MRGRQCWVDGSQVSTPFEHFLQPQDFFTARPARVAIHQLLSTNWPAYRSKSGYLKLFDVQTFFWTHLVISALSLLPPTLSAHSKSGRCCWKRDLTAQKRGTAGELSSRWLAFCFPTKKINFGPTQNGGSSGDLTNDFLAVWLRGRNKMELILFVISKIYLWLNQPICTATCSASIKQNI